jgi:hypothetical protein
MLLYCGTFAQNLLVRLRLGSPLTKAHMVLRLRGATPSDGFYVFDWAEGNAAGRTSNAGANCPTPAEARLPFRRMRIIRVQPGGTMAVLKEIFVGCKRRFLYDLAVV